MTSPVKPDPIGDGEVAVTPWEEAAEKVCAEMVSRAEKPIRRMAEELYEGMMIDVQDYLRENVSFNLSGELDRAHGYYEEAKIALAKVAKAVGVSFVDASDRPEKQAERILAAYASLVEEREKDGAAIVFAVERFGMWRAQAGEMEYALDGLRSRLQAREVKQ